MLSFLSSTPAQMQETLRSKFRSHRRAMKLTQAELAKRSDVSLGSIKRFESSGQISLESLLKVALVLECLDGFEKLCEVEERFGNIDEVVGDRK